MTMLTIQEVQARLPELIDRLVPGEELMILDHDDVVARLTVEPKSHGQRRQPGSARGELIIVEDDDEHLEDFKDYMP